MISSESADAELHEALSTFDLPSSLKGEGWIIEQEKPIALQTVGASIMHQYGIVIKHPTKRARQFLCLANETCRNENTCIKISETSSNAVRHLRSKHQVSKVASSKKRGLEGVECDTTLGILDQEHPYAFGSELAENTGTGTAKKLKKDCDENESILQQELHQALLEYEVPPELGAEGWSKFQRGGTEKAKTIAISNESIIHKYGILLVHPGKKQRLFVCLANGYCRKHRTTIKLLNTSSNAVRHLRLMHGVQVNTAAKLSPTTKSPQAENENDKTNETLQNSTELCLYNQKKILARLEQMQATLANLTAVTLQLVKRSQTSDSDSNV